MKSKVNYIGTKLKHILSMFPSQLRERSVCVFFMCIARLTMQCIVDSRVHLNSRVSFFVDQAFET